MTRWACGREDDYFASRYGYLTEYVRYSVTCRGTGRSDFKGDYATMNDCRVSRAVAADEGDCPAEPMPGWPSPPSMRTTTLTAKGQHANGLCPDRRTHDAAAGSSRDVEVLCAVHGDRRQADEAARAIGITKRAPMKKRWRGSPSRVRKIPAPATIPTCARWPTPPRRSALTCGHPGRIVCQRRPYA